MRDFVLREMGGGSENARIKSIEVSDSVRLPKGRITYKVVPPKNVDLSGTFPVAVLFKAQGAVQKKVWAVVKVEIMTRVVVTTRPLGRYQVITQDDICVKKIALGTASSPTIPDFGEVLGKRAKRKIAANSVLRADLIEMPPLVKRGDRVRIIAESEGLKVSARGEAREKGCRGDTIRVVNIDSKRAVYARILDENTVKVKF